MDNIRTGDAILHKPSGEKWLVAYCRDGYVCCCGWPESQAKVEHCEAIRKATDEQNEKLLREMIGTPGSRGRYARAELNRRIFIGTPTPEGGAE